MKLIVSILALALVAFSSSGAAALPPPNTDLFCAAAVHRVLPIHQATIPDSEHDLGTDSEFSVELEADSAKTVSGTLAIQSGKNAYKVPFANQTLSPVTYTTKQDDKVLSTVIRYRSAPIYFDLPSMLPVDAVWISDIAQNGKPAICAALPVAWEPQTRDVDSVTTQDDAASAQEVRSKIPASILQARPDPAFTRGNCSTPLKWASTLVVAPVSYPSGMAGRATVIVRLAVDAAGKVVDAEIAESSGRREFDDAGLASAVQTTYAPAQFLCAPIPGFYYFRAHFDP